MSLLEKSIRRLSPRWALQREQARYAIKAYEAAKPSRLHEARKETGNINRIIGSQGKSLRDQARYLEQNSDIVDGLLNVLVNNCVGKTGIGVEPMPLNEDGSIHESFGKELLERFSEWSLKCESTGTWSRPEVERLVCRSWLRDGECFGELIQGNVTGFSHPNERIPFSLQVMEADFVPFQRENEKNQTFQGITMNAWGQPEVFHVLAEPPDELHQYGLDVKTRPVSANNMLHIKFVKRLHQLRGCTILGSSLLRLAGLANYEESELVAARIAASMAFYIRKGDSASYEFDPSSGQMRDYLNMHPGTIFDDLEPGEDVGTIESKRPNSLMQNFRDCMVRMICSATGANFSSVAKLYEGNYSAQRQELIESYLNYGVLSDQFTAQWSRPVYRHFVTMGISTGVIRIPRGVNSERVTNAFYQAPVCPWIDPLKEASANNQMIAGGLGTEAEFIRQRGKNPSEVKKRRITEIQENRDNDLVFSNDPFHQYYGTKNIKPETPDNDLD